MQGALDRHCRLSRHGSVQRPLATRRMYSGMSVRTGQPRMAIHDAVAVARVPCVGGLHESKGTACGWASANAGADRVCQLALLPDSDGLHQPAGKPSRRARSDNK